LCLLPTAFKLSGLIDSIPTTTALQPLSAMAWQIFRANPSGDFHLSHPSNLQGLQSLAQLNRSPLVHGKVIVYEEDVAAAGSLHIPHHKLYWAKPVGMTEESGYGAKGAIMGAAPACLDGIESQWEALVG